MSIQSCVRFFPISFNIWIHGRTTEELAGAAVFANFIIGEDWQGLMPSLLLYYSSLIELEWHKRCHMCVLKKNGFVTSSFRLFTSPTTVILNLIPRLPLSGVTKLVTLLTSVNWFYIMRVNTWPEALNSIRIFKFYPVSHFLFIWGPGMVMCAWTGVKDNIAKL